MDPSQEDRRDVLEYTWSFLEKNGYEQYEVSNFVRRDNNNTEGEWMGEKRSRHNLNYWRNGGFYGFGMGATSFVGGVRQKRPTRLGGYYRYVEGLIPGGGLMGKGVGEVVAGEYFEDYVLNRFRLLEEGVDLDEVGRLFGEEAREKIEEVVREKGFVKRGLVEVVEGGNVLRLKRPEGVLLENTVVSAILESTVWC